MATYLFITYGEEGWRGVQMRAVRMANYFLKDDVLFWNLYDSTFIEQQGFTVETKKSGLYASQDIIFPEDIKVVIFADIPSNELFAISVYNAAKAQNKRIVICEQVYRRGQMKETVFRTFANDCDLFLLNGLSFFKGEESENILLIPPQAEIELNPTIKENIFATYNIPLDRKLLFGTGYHPEIAKKIKNVVQALPVDKESFHLILAGDTGEKGMIQEGNITTIPFVFGEAYFQLLYAADIVLVKFGFLQILEALAMRKPTIVMGEPGNVLQKNVLDEAYKRVLFFVDKKSDEDTIKYISSLLVDSSMQQKMHKQLENIHNGELFGAQKAAQAITQLVQKKHKHISKKGKKLVILMNNEIIEKKEWLRRQENILTICLCMSMPGEKKVIKRMPEDVQKLRIKDIAQGTEDEILPTNFVEWMQFSPRKYDGFIKMLPWFNEYIHHLQDVLEHADTIYLSQQSNDVLSSLMTLEQKNKKILI